MSQGRVEIGQCISDGYAAFKDNIGPAILGFLVYSIISSAGNQIPFINIIFAILVAGPLQGGLTILQLNLVDRRNPAVGDLFKGFNNFTRFLGLYCLMAVVSVGVCLVAMLPAILVGGAAFLKLGASVMANPGQPPVLPTGSMAGALFFVVLGIIAALIFLVRFIFAFFVMADAPEMRATESLKKSAELVKGNTLSIILASIVIGLVAMLGIIACGIGLLATIPIAGCAMAALFRQLSPASGAAMSRVGLEAAPAGAYGQPSTSAYGQPPYTPSTPRATGAYLDGSSAPDIAAANASASYAQAAPRAAGNYLDGSPASGSAQGPGAAPAAGAAAGAPPAEAPSAPTISLVTRYSALMDSLRIDQAGVSFIQRGQAAISHGSPITALAFSPDGMQIVSAGIDGGIKVWDRYRREMKSEIAGTSQPVTCVAMSPDKGTILAAFREEMQLAQSPIRIINAYSGRQLNAVVLHGHPATALAFSPTGDKAASCSGDRTVKVWDPATGMEIMSWTHPEACLAVVFSLDGSRVVSASRDATITIWDVWTANSVMTWPPQEGGPFRAVVSAGGEWLAFQNAGNTARLVDVRSGQVVGNWSARGRIKAVYAANGSVVVWEVNGSELLAYHVQSGRYLAPQQGALGEIRCVDVSSDGMCVAAGAGDGTIGIWEAS